MVSTRLGSTADYAAGWEQAFGKKSKSTKTTVKAQATSVAAKGGKKLTAAVESAPVKDKKKSSTAGGKADAKVTTSKVKASKPTASKAPASKVSTSKATSSKATAAKTKSKSSSKVVKASNDKPAKKSSPKTSSKSRTKKAK